MADRTALSLIRRARTGDESAQLALGRLYLDGGNGLSADPAAAYVWLEKPAKRGNAAALALIGERVPAAAVADPETATPLFERAAASGCASAMRVLADWALSGAICDFPVARAVTMLETAARTGDVGAQLRLAWCLEHGEGCPPAPDAALHWYERAAQSGSHAAKELLADRYWHLGRDEARSLLEDCARRGSPSAAGRLGLQLLREGRCAEAVPWLRQAAVAGGVEAQLALGRLHATRGGRAVSGVPHSYKSAVAWFECAAREGSAEAWFELSCLHSLRSNSLRDPWAARRYLERAADLGHTEAQYRCGTAYLGRHRDLEDEITASHWLLRAAAAGHAGARQCLRATWPCPEPPSPEVMRDRGAAIRVIARVDLDLARRIEVGEVLGLPADVALRIDPHADDRGHCVVLRGVRTPPRARRRLVLIDTSEKRAAIDRAKRAIGAEGTETDGAARARIRRFVGLLHSAGLRHTLFDWMDSRGQSPLRVLDRGSPASSSTV